MQKFKKICRVIFNILLAIILIFLIMLVICNISLNIQKRKGEKTPNILGYAPISVVDNNLNPDIKENDFLIIHLTTDFKEGDYLTYLFSNEKDCRTQRLVQIVYSENGQYVTQYIVENSAGEKSVVLPIYVYGKVVTNFSGFAPVVKFFNSVPGTSVLIALALILIFIPDIIAILQDKRKKKVTDVNSGENQEKKEIGK